MTPSFKLARFGILCVVWLACLSSPDLSAAEQNRTVSSHRYRSGQVLVQFKPGIGASERQAVRRLLGAKRRNRLALEKLPAASAETPGKGALELIELPRRLSMTAALARLRRDPRVEFAEPNWVNRFEALVNDEYVLAGWTWNLYGNNTSPASLYGSQVSESWMQGYTGSREIVIGIIDEGVEVDHPDLAANIWTNPYDPPDGLDNDGNGYIDDVHGWDAFHGDNTVYDGGPAGTVDRHGTHVAGIIGAKGGNRIGIAGINWNVTLIPCKIGEGDSSTASAIECLDYLTDLKKRHGLNIVATNNSWGGGGYSSALLAAINRAGDAGILFVTSAGNGSADNDATAYYPANYTCTNSVLRDYDCILTVASMNSMGTLSSFSNYGASSVDIAAPGTSIYSTVPPGQYDTMNGTSMAAPHVTGTIALYAARKQDPATGQIPQAGIIRQAILDGAAHNANFNGKIASTRQLDVDGALSR